MAKSIVDHLAHSLGRRDEQPNIDLAVKIAKTGDANAIKELVGLLSHKKTAWAHDAIKVLYETGERNPGGDFETFYPKTHFYTPETDRCDGNPEQSKTNRKTTSLFYILISPAHALYFTT